MADAVLIQQCAMWCRMKNVEPIVPHDTDAREFMESAVRDYEWDFKRLNERQRAAIAGLA